jgi:hypothetical protein
MTVEASRFASESLFQPAGSALKATFSSGTEHRTTRRPKRLLSNEPVQRRRVASTATVTAHGVGQRASGQGVPCK